MSSRLPAKLSRIDRGEGSVEFLSLEICGRRFADVRYGARIRKPGEFLLPKGIPLQPPRPA